MLKAEDFKWMIDKVSNPEFKKSYLDTYVGYVNCTLKYLGDYDAVCNSDETCKSIDLYSREYGHLGSVVYTEETGKWHVEIWPDDEFALRTFKEWHAISAIVDMIESLNHEING